MKKTNILILSCGTRNKIVQYFKKELQGKGEVVATDCSLLAPALYEADKYFIVPKLTEPNYLEKILEICINNEISSVLSLIDPELTFLAKSKQSFLDINVVPIVSDIDSIETCFNKYKFYDFLKKTSFNTIRSYVSKDLFYEDCEKGLINFPVFVKPICGSASNNISKVVNRKQLDFLFDNYNDLIIQEFMNGEEYGADVYIDLITKNVISIFIKKKIKMRAGETDKSVSIKDNKLFDLIIQFIGQTNLKGIIDIDIFKVNDEYYISEINPRFGGGFPHAYECGVNIPRMIINNLEGAKNEPIIGDYYPNIFMMKYNEIIVKNISDKDFIE